MNKPKHTNRDAGTRCPCGLLLPTAVKPDRGSCGDPQDSKSPLLSLPWKRVVGSAALLLLSALLVACSSSIEATDVRTVEFEVPQDVEIEIDSGGGSILLRGEPNRTTVTITATLHSFATTMDIAEQQVSDLEIAWGFQDH
ncbi:hypothetical protein JW848_10700, partial [Candidatus Bipolaricaulota bacterium]|nr:hypothetical protein [Candidatus Bipolaricaulota bacterium]